MIADTGAEVVGLQEVDRHFHARSGFVDQAGWLAGRLDADVAFGAAIDAEPLSPGEPRRQYGNAVLSVHPIRASATVALPGSLCRERRVMLQAVVTVRGVTVHVVATHLQNRAPDERRRQAGAVRDHVTGAGGTAVVLADLNARPRAAEVAMLTRHLVDAWDVAGAGPGHTFDAATPHARIDYVLASPGVTVHSAVVVPTDASDHLPVVADLAPAAGWQTAAP